jgi:putative phosphoesterase
MRLGLISDIHANLHALDAAIAALRREGVDRFVCAGDLVGYGPFPNECVERVASLDAVTVAGNHDLIALGRLSDDRCIPLARNSLRWTRDALRDDARRYLAALPLRIQIGSETVMAHGSLDDPQEYVSQPSQAVAQLEQLSAEFPGARLLILGHTHRPRAHTANGMLLDLRTPTSLAEGSLALINPGSVGQARERAALARFALLDLEIGQATFMSAAYDTAACRTALRRLGLPAGSCHLAPSLMASGVGRARQLGGRIARLAKWGLRGVAAPRAPTR